MYTLQILHAVRLNVEINMQNRFNTVLVLKTMSPTPLSPLLLFNLLAAKTCLCRSTPKPSIRYTIGLHPVPFSIIKELLYGSGPNSGISMASSLQSYSQSYSRSNISQSRTVQSSKDQHNGLKYQTLFPYFNSSTSFIFRVWCNNFRHPLWPYLHQCPTTHPSLPSLSSV